MEIPFSIAEKRPRQRSSHTSSAAGSAHHRASMPVRRWSATQKPPISAVSTSVSRRISAASGTDWNRMPNRSRTAAASVCLLTAASRPDISIRKIRHTVASAIAHRRRKPNAAPACAEVESEPTSMKPAGDRFGMVQALAPRVRR